MLPHQIIMREKESPSAILPEEKIDKLFSAYLNLPYPVNYDFYEKNGYKEAQIIAQKTLINTISELTIAKLETNLSNLPEVVEWLSNTLVSNPNIEKSSEKDRYNIISPLLEEILTEMQIIIDNESIISKEDLKIEEIISSVRVSMWERIGCHKY